MESFPSQTKEFIYGTFVYQYELIRQDRKTLGLTITPDLQIFVKCPRAAHDERIELFLKKKWFWLQKQLHFFKKYKHKVYKKEYVSGEGFLYLGRQYTLIVKRASYERVSVSRGVITVQTREGVANSTHTKRMIDAWYQDRAKTVFVERYEEMQKRFEYDSCPTLGIRTMDKRWGSLLKNTLLLNPKLIQAPKECLDYVIVHELCHVRHKDHGKEFWKLLDKKYPNWQKVKEKLEILMA